MWLVHPTTSILLSYGPTLEQLYEEFKYFCEQNVIPKSSIAMFRIHLETLDNINISYDDNGIKIKLITIY